MKRIFIICCITSILGFAAERNFTAEIGGGVSYSKGIYKSKSKSDFSFLPHLYLSYGNFYLSNFEIGYQIQPNENLSLSIYTNIQDGFPIEGKDLKDGYKSIKERKSQVALGGRIVLVLEDIQIQAFAQGGKRGASSGLGIVYDMPITDKLNLDYGINYTFYSKKFMDYYFGISKNDFSKEINKEYSPKASYSYGAQIGVNYSFTESFSVFSSLSAEKYSKGFYNSPIVDKKLDLTGIVGIKFSF